MLGDELIDYQLLSRFVDLFHFFPITIIKDKNFSEELYMVLSSNKASKYGVLW